MGEGGRLDAGRRAEHAITGAVIGRLRRHVGPCDVGLGADLATRPSRHSALATTALEVSGTSGRAGIALVTGVAGWAESAEATLICPALTWTVLTLTGFIGSDEPGMAASDWDWITPLVSGAGSALGIEAVAAAKIDRVSGACAGAAAGSGAAAASWTGACSEVGARAAGAGTVSACAMSAPASDGHVR